MLRLFVISAGLFLLGSLASAQTQPTHTTSKPTTHKAATAARPDPNVPTKVTGPGTLRLQGSNIGTSK